MSKKAFRFGAASGVFGLLLILVVTLLLSWATQSVKPTQYSSMTNKDFVPGTSSVSSDEWMDKFLEVYEKRMGPVEPQHRTALWGNAIVMCNFLSVESKDKYQRAYEFGTDHLGMSSDQTVAVIETAGQTYCPDDYTAPPKGEL